VLGPLPAVHANAVLAVGAGFRAGGAALHAEVLSGGSAVVARVHVMEALAAVDAEVLLIFAVLHAHAVGALAVVLAAVDTQAAVVALVHVVKAGIALLAEMLRPLGALHAVVAAGAALSLRVFQAAFDAQAAVGADFKFKGLGAAAALVTDPLLAAVHAVLAAVGAPLKAFVHRFAIGAPQIVLIDAILADFHILAAVESVAFATVVAPDTSANGTKYSAAVIEHTVLAVPVALAGGPTPFNDVRVALVAVVALIGTAIDADIPITAPAYFHVAACIAAAADGAVHFQILYTAHAQAVAAAGVSTLLRACLAVIRVAGVADGAVLGLGGTVGDAVAAGLTALTEVAEDQVGILAQGAVSAGAGGAVPADEPVAVVALVFSAKTAIVVHVAALALPAMAGSAVPVGNALVAPVAVGAEPVAVVVVSFAAGAVRILVALVHEHGDALAAAGYQPAARPPPLAGVGGSSYQIKLHLDRRGGRARGLYGLMHPAAGAVGAAYAVGTFSAFASAAAAIVAETFPTLAGAVFARAVDARAAGVISAITAETFPVRAGAVFTGAILAGAVRLRVDVLMRRLLRHRRGNAASRQAAQQQDDREQHAQHFG